ncbi:MAG: helix-turn-helix domain-containing protein [Gordonia sp. (in: high G+C Gram-positive bacteria)]|uniref:TetR/AcrR family transcriptional regulator n=1 Tax=Gordonia sp. (in: high G+C Gram-positive bacteria) TaxID=84139 RepID=UPI003BB712AD
MARRLAPDQRRAEILAKTRALIAENGPAGLSLRSVARYCDLTAPGLLHHFAGLQPLLEEVIAERDAEEFRAAAALLADIGASASILDLGDALVGHIAAHAAEARNFDALEADAVADVSHPAHAYYTRPPAAPNAATVALAARHYREPEAVVTILMVLVDGMRHRWLRARTTPDYIGDWQQLRSTVEECFQPFRQG